MPIDYSRYPKNWRKEIVPAILNRAGHKCEVCGLGNGQIVFSIKMMVRDIAKYKQRSVWFSSRNDADRECLTGEVKEVKVVLTIAHLDHDEENHDIKYDRLMAMCQCCHLRYDADEKYRRQQEKWKLK